MKLVVIGAGGLGSEVMMTAERGMSRLRDQFGVDTILGFCDDSQKLKGSLLFDYPILDTIESVAKTEASGIAYLCAVGNNSIREKVVERANALGWKPVTVIDPTAVLCRNAEIGVGTYVSAGVMISVNAKVGNHVILNHCATVGHDAVAEDFSHMAPGARLLGASKAGRGSTIQTNAVVFPMKSLGDRSMLGAGSYAMRNLEPDTTAFGNPAKIIFKNNT